MSNIIETRTKSSNNTNYAATKESVLEVMNDYFKNRKLEIVQLYEGDINRKDTINKIEFLERDLELCTNEYLESRVDLQKSYNSHVEETYVSTEIDGLNVEITLFQADHDDDYNTLTWSVFEYNTRIS